MRRRECQGRPDSANHVYSLEEPWPHVLTFLALGSCFASRSKMAALERQIRVEGTKLFVAELDAIHGTPVIDIKTVMKKFLPREEIRQPESSRELMWEYWQDKP
jgi:tRNA (adenine37-N6)-methyltransferase